MTINFYEKRDKFRNKHFYPKTGSAIYLPKKNYSGESIGDIINWLTTNSSAIKDVTTAGSTALTTVGKVAIDVTKGIQEIKNLRTLQEQIRQKQEPVITESAQEKILAAVNERKTGEGFKLCLRD